MALSRAVFEINGDICTTFPPPLYLTPPLGVSLGFLGNFVTAVVLEKKPE